MLGQQGHSRRRCCRGTSSTATTVPRSPSSSATSGGIVHGNFGYSYKLNQTVAALFKENAGRSAYLSGAALVLSLIIAVPLGIAQAVKRNSPGDYAATAHQLHAVLDAVVLPRADPDPVPRARLGHLPAGRQRLSHQHLAGDHRIPQQLFLPIVTLALLNVASFSRYMRSSALDELAQDYIRLARAKGLSRAGRC